MHVGVIYAMQDNFMFVGHRSYEVTAKSDIEVFFTFSALKNTKKEAVLKLPFGNEQPLFLILGSRAIALCRGGKRHKKPQYFNMHS